MKILIGTTNPSKVDYFETLMAGMDVESLTLRDLDIRDEPQETGNTPLQNARIKAAFYGQYAETVICADSGLYFDGLPLDDPRQPGLHIRTPQGGKRLDDEQMIAYYAALAHSLGGRVHAYYMDAMALGVRGALYDFEATREEARTWAFDLVDTPCVWRRAGWPLDSLSLEPDGHYFLDPDRPQRRQPQEKAGYRDRLRAFLIEKLNP